MNKFVLTADAEIDPNGFRVYIDGAFYSTGEIAKEYDALKTECKFWRQAAEHALTLMNALEDRVEAAKEAIRALEGNAGAALELLGGTEEAPPELKIVT